MLEFFKRIQTWAHLLGHDYHGQWAVVGPTEDAASHDRRRWRHRGWATAPTTEELGDGRLEFGADWAVDEEVARRVDDQEAVIERREAEEPNRGSKFWKKNKNIIKLYFYPILPYIALISPQMALLGFYHNTSPHDKYSC